MTPYEQEARDKDASFVSPNEIVKRITEVDYQTNGEIVECVICVDNGFRVVASADGAKTNLDIAQTTAYGRAFDQLQSAFDFLRAEQMYWVRAQEREMGMMKAFGVQDGL